MELIAVQGDALEFEFTITDETGEPYEMQEGDKLFFMVAESCISGDCKIHIEQAESYFQISKIDLKPGNYDFDAGIIFADGRVKTLINADTGRLIVKRSAGER